MIAKLLSSTSLDKFAIFLSGACVVHCLVTPIALTVLPLFLASNLLEDVLFHKAILWFVLPTSCIALFVGCRKHRDLFIASTGIAGMLLLVLIAFFAHDILSSFQEKMATSVAGLILAVSHALNYKACQQQPCDDAQCATKHHH